MRAIHNQQFLADVKARLLDVFADRLRGVVLYGSSARGDAAPDSDIDLLVLLDPPVNLGPDVDAVVGTLYPLQLELERRINALPVPYPSYEAGEFGLYRNAKREGVLA
jgi:predicted nucleotidyltransferase